MGEVRPEARWIFLLSAKYNVVMTTSEMARILGRKGGAARARRLPTAERARIAALGGAARAESKIGERRILDNLRYAEAIWQLRPPPPLRRNRACPKPLPDVVARVRSHG